MRDRLNQLITSSTHHSSEENAPAEKTELSIRRAGHLPKLNIFVIYLHDSIKAGTELEINIGFSSSIWVHPEGLFLGSYSSENGTKQ